MSSLDALDKDPLIYLTTFLDELDVLNLSVTCKTLRNTINNCEAIWTALALRRFDLVGSVDLNWYRLARSPRCLSSATVKEVKKVRDVTGKIDGEVQEMCAFKSHAFVLSKTAKSRPMLCCLSLEDQCWYARSGWNKAGNLKGGAVDGKSALSLIADGKTVVIDASIPISPDGLFMPGPPTPHKLPDVEYEEGHTLIGQGATFMDHQYGTVQLWRDEKGRLILTRTIFTLEQKK